MLVSVRRYFSVSSGCCQAKLRRGLMSRELMGACPVRSAGRRPFNSSGECILLLHHAACSVASTCTVSTDTRKLVFDAHRHRLFRRYDGLSMFPRGPTSEDSHRASLVGLSLRLMRSTSYARPFCRMIGPAFTCACASSRWFHCPCG